MSHMRIEGVAQFLCSAFGGNVGNQFDRELPNTGGNPFDRELPNIGAQEDLQREMHC